MERIAFRDLPGIYWIEKQLELQGRLMKDEQDELDRRIEAKSVEFFGIGLADTYYDRYANGSTPEGAEEWETQFDFLEVGYDEESVFWDAFGIDITDGKGDQLLCMDVFGRQLVCGLRGLLPNATFTPMTGTKSDAQIQAEAKLWGERLTKRP